MILPNFYFEKKLWNQGFKVVAGCDEVGRGCFAGPVVASVCAFAPNKVINLPIIESGCKVIIDDSKKLTSLEREKANLWIRKNSFAYGLGVGSVSEINRYGILKATNSAFRRAIKDLYKRYNICIDYLLIDAFYIPYVRGLCMPRKNERLKNKKVLNGKLCRFCGKQMAIKNGDEKSISIAAASIIAKVFRDKLMISLSEKYSVYGWEKNKGYGTSDHTKAILKYGLTPYHRKKFVETFFNNCAFSQARSKT